ncbi:protein of unknown function [Micropruina glycogenica]|uniref:Uncharacterized protein n=1 Tax=Micropruina glycogenica TaxID=75385 RepID=A0A2N9JK50_9ACTN|nr:protein of unknown function [Micropruina glycogenica]
MAQPRARQFSPNCVSTGCWELFVAERFSFECAPGRHVVGPGCLSGSRVGRLSRRAFIGCGPPTAVRNEAGLRRFTQRLALVATKGRRTATAVEGLTLTLYLPERRPVEACGQRVGRHR